jgi:polyphenol oxidase
MRETAAAAPRWSDSPGPGLRQAELCDGVQVLLTGRPGGHSAGHFSSRNLSYSVGDDPAAVSANRASLLNAIGEGPGQLAFMRQVHGTDVAFATASPGVVGPEAAESPEVDAIITESPEVALAVVVADCAPVLLADPSARLVGAAHSGRAGMAAGVVPALVAAMELAGADPARMHALIGPMICGGCYEVPAQMRDEVAALVPDSACRTRKGTPGIDIRAGVRAQLVSSGVSRITDDSRCTAETDDLYSYRRDGTTGRFAGLIWLTG